MKKQKHWGAVLLSFLLAVSLLVGCSGTSNEDATPLMLWQVTDDEGHTLYLMGSIHVGTEESIPPEQTMIDAYESSDALAVEIDLLAYDDDILQQLEISTRYSQYEDGSSVQEHLDADVYEEAKAVLMENSSYQSSYDYLTVNQWSSLFRQLAMKVAGYESKYGMDRYWLSLAKEDGKTIYELESVAQQMDMMESYSEALQAWLLESAISIENAAKSLQNTMAAWVKGDAEALASSEKEISEDLTETEAELLEEYWDKVIFTRNDEMADAAESYLQSGETVFFTVGAGHMGGTRGIVNQLREKGYTVQQVHSGGTLCEESCVHLEEDDDAELLDAA
jgi:uncharacterized protein YbaP (TraB family)